MKAKSLLLLRFAVLIVCVCFFHIASAQDVRQKPVVSKPAKPATTPKTTTVKKQTKSTPKKVSYPPRELSLQDFLCKPIGIMNMDLNDRTIPFSKFESAIKRKYYIDTSSSTPNVDLELHSFAHPSLEALRYHGLHLDDFRLYNSGSFYFREIQYTFEIQFKDMTKPWTGYVEDIVNDFHQMGIPITFEETPNGEYSVAGEGKIEIGDVKYSISVQDFHTRGNSDSYLYRITVYLGMKK